MNGVVIKALPSDISAEKSVLGSMLIDKETITIISEMLSQDDFYNKIYGLIYKAIIELNEKGTMVDFVTLQSKMTEMGEQELLTTEMFMDIIGSVPTSVNAKNYAKIVYDKSVLRSIINSNEEINQKCYANGSVEEIIEETEKNTLRLQKTQKIDDCDDIKTIVMNVLKKIETASKNHSLVTGVSCGFKDIDTRLSGLQPSDLILLAARPSMGKTAFALNIARNVAKNGTTTAIFSLEMSKEQLVSRMLSMESLVNQTNLRNGYLLDEDWEKVIEGAGVLGDSKLIIDDTPAISINELKSKCRKYKMEKNLGIVIIDYLQLMTTNRRSESRQHEISEISRSLKALARELNVPVIALSQLSRDVEKRPDKRPILSDLRESGAIEQDADVVMFIYRDDYYRKDSQEKNVAEIITAKQRNGPTGVDKLVWRPQYTSFANMVKY